MITGQKVLMYSGKKISHTFMRIGIIQHVFIFDEFQLELNLNLKKKKHEVFHAICFPTDYFNWLFLQ